MMNAAYGTNMSGLFSRLDFAVLYAIWGNKFKGMHVMLK
jgi:hypothetical protein